jgi:MFS family permease
MVRSESDIILLFVTRIGRLFAYGFLSVVLVLYLAQVGLSGGQIGLLLTLTLVGDAVISLWITTSADRIGRRKMLVCGALLMVLAGGVFVLTRNFTLLVLAAIVGVLSPSGNEIGPFLSLEQAALSELLPARRRTHAFAWYNLAGSLATALGALTGGWLAQFLQMGGARPVEAYRVVLAGYVVFGGLLALIFLTLSPSVEASRRQGSPVGRRKFGLYRSQSIVFKLSSLFALDAFAGGFVVQSIVVYWFHLKFGLHTGILGSIFFGANLLAGISALLAVRIAARIGLIRTMVFTHLPSNVLLCLVPLMPSAWLAITVLLLRFSISQMDVPTRQSYTMSVVAPDERSAASGLTAIARSIGAALSPALSGFFLARAVLLSAPFLVAGGLKIAYDLLLYRAFRRLRPPEEMQVQSNNAACVSDSRGSCS